VSEKTKTFEYDPAHDIVKIEGIWFSMDYFRDMKTKPVHTRFEIVQRNNETGAITLRTV
jgi:hypothetical protein